MTQTEQVAVGQEYSPAEIEFIQSLYDRYSENGGVIDLTADGPAFMAIVHKHASRLASTRPISNEHVWYTCSEPCPKHEEGQHCQYCDGGLAFCTICQKGEGELADKCPGPPISNEEVRGLVERLEVAAPFPVRQQAIAALQHLSAENDRLAAREAEAREIIANLLENERLYALESGMDDCCCVGSPKKRAECSHAHGRNWLKAGEAEHE